MSKNDGGPAFPLKNYTSEIGPDNCGFMAKDHSGTSLWVNSGSPGMSLRDWFAGQVLAGRSATNLAHRGPARSMEIATDAYLQADAMLLARGG